MKLWIRILLTIIILGSSMLLTEFLYLPKLISFIMGFIVGGLIIQFIWIPIIFKH